jgi:acyl dehydratase
VALDYDLIMGMAPMETRQALTVRDTILYALGVGAGLDAPTDPGELQYVYEEGLKALPTMAVVLGYPGFWAKDPRYGIDWKRLLLGEESIQIHRPLPVEGAILGVTTIDEIYDKGPDKGAVMYSSRKIYDEASGDLIATARKGAFLRGDGGCGGSKESAPAPHPLPDRAPDLALDMQTRPEQALIYRLSGDYNPLHVDPATAAAGGFPRPILHGLVSYAIAGRAVISALCDGRPEQLKRIDARFSSPVFPGETLSVDLWREGPGRAAFRVRIAARGVTALQNGYVEYGD